MPKNCVCIYNKEYMSRSSFYLQDTNSDLFVVLNEKIYPLHINFLHSMEYFTHPSFVKEMVHIIQSNVHININEIDPKWFQAVIGYYYGRPLEYFRDWTVIELLKMIKFVQCKELQKKIFEDIEINFDDYGFFLLLNISFSFKTKWLKQKCEEELILMNFQQLNYNRFDFYQIDVNALKEIIKLHQLLRINQNIIGINKKILNRIVSEYCKANRIVDIQIQALITHCQQSARESTKQEISQSYLVKAHDNELVLSKNDIAINQNSETKKNSKKSACKIQQRRNKIYEEISKMPDIKQRKNQADQLHDMYNIDEKVRRFQKTCEQHDTKYQNLKKQMQKLNSGNRKAQQNSLYQQQQRVEVEKRRKQKKVGLSPNKLFSQMPKLMQESDSQDDGE